MNQFVVIILRNDYPFTANFMKTDITGSYKWHFLHLNTVHENPDSR
jgi:hypothetical protein